MSLKGGSFGSFAQDCRVRLPQVLDPATLPLPDAGIQSWPVVSENDISGAAPSAAATQAVKSAYDMNE
ncbi:hypothetical protein [Arthrobacter sp. QXT-31]|uniref:hypothetical protein n=1 Tax=Arthrobacter sp. QXT-31 TaxID=1357915 RepID=UPI0012F94CB6|nr:hypothetical protein [Arthrobacter sp. QXT-31]